MSQPTYQNGLEAAAKFLEATAADFEQLEKQIADRLQTGKYPFPGHKVQDQQEQKLLQAKKSLLRGQAKRIRKMK